MSKNQTPLIERAYNWASILFFFYSVFFLLGMFYHWFAITSLPHSEFFITAFSIAFISNGMLLLFVGKFPRTIKTIIFSVFTPALLALMIFSLIEIQF